MCVTAAGSVTVSRTRLQYLSGHLHDNPHGGTRLGRARDDATQHPEEGSVQQVYVVRSGGVPEAAADVDSVRQFK